MKKRAMIAIAGAVAVVGIAAGGAAVATSGNDDGPASHDYTPAQQRAAEAAALKATGGGSVNSMETDHENGATYEVEVKKPDGSTVDVRLDASYGVVVIESDSGG
ncbi:PepSY domain-containing protein [Marmoricola sp. RAF53]|uniref:PepSY domain-containing protein n=1 Tax=Marmoricola sp. RAF53 TaxID=3233059 RepID=UPI003F973714